MMLRGLGDEMVNTTVLPGSNTTVTNAPIPQPTFMNGLSVWWPSPMNGVSAVQTVFSNVGAAFSSSTWQFTVGVLAPPLVLLSLLLGGRRR